MGRPSQGFMACYARSIDGHYYTRYPNGDAPLGALLSSSVASVVTAGAALMLGSQQLRANLAAVATAQAVLNTLAGDNITTASPLPSGAVGVPYSATLAVTGGAAPYLWTLASGTLPPALSLSSAGVISGTPSTAAPPGAAALGYNTAQFNFAPQLSDIVPANIQGTGPETSYAFAGRNAYYNTRNSDWLDGPLATMVNGVLSLQNLGVAGGGACSALFMQSQLSQAGKYGYVDMSKGCYVSIEYALSNASTDHWDTMYMMPQEHYSGSENYIEVDVHENGFSPAQTIFSTFLSWCTAKPVTNFQILDTVGSCSCDTPVLPIGPAAMANGGSFNVKGVSTGAGKIGSAFYPGTLILPANPLSGTGFHITNVTVVGASTHFTLQTNTNQPITTTPGTPTGMTFAYYLGGGQSGDNLNSYNFRSNIIDTTQFNRYAFRYDPVRMVADYLINDIVNFTVNTNTVDSHGILRDSSIRNWHYYPIVIPQSHSGASSVAYSMYVRNIQAWHP